MGKATKVRRLKFDDDAEGRERYKLLYQGFLNGGNSAQSKGMDVLRREAEILDKFQNAGTLPPTDGEPNEMERELNPSGAAFDVDNAEYELLKRYFEKTPWVTRLAIKVVNIADWLSAIPLEDTNG